MSRANGHKSRVNRRTVRERPCLLCGNLPSDPHHYPVRVSHGAGDTLLEMVPLCHHHHRLWHDGDDQVRADLEACYGYYYDEVRRTLEEK
ncbi:MAG: hypothetical protein WC977_13825 [Anaerovoracaceae bacterium]